MNMDDGFFYTAIGCAIVILMLGGIAIMRKYPRIKKRQTIADEDPNLYAVAMRAWESGNGVVGTVDDNGNLTMEEIKPPAHRRDCGMPSCFICYGGK